MDAIRRTCLGVVALLTGGAVAQALQTTETSAPRPLMRMYGTAGPIDYASTMPRTNIVTGSLIAGVARQFEHPADLISSEIRGIRVTLDHNAIGALAGSPDPRLVLPVFDGESLEIVFVSRDVRAADSTVWLGKIAGIPMSDVIFVEHEGDVLLDVRDYQNDRRFKIRLQPDGSYALREARLGQPAGSCGGCGPGALLGPLHNAGVPSSGSNLGGNFAMRGSLPNDPPDQVDILFVLTAEARSGYGTQNAFTLEAIAAVSDFNFRAQNSGIPVELRLVAADWDLLSSYSESDSGSDDLNAIGVSGSLGPQINAARERYRCDLVTMIREETWTGGIFSTINGVAFRPGNSAQLNPAAGLSVNAREADIVDGLFSHEIGHNFGMCHDIDTSLNDESCLPFNAAIRVDGRGWVESCSLGIEVITTMSYSGLTSIPAPVFSNAGIILDVGGLCGAVQLGRIGIAEAYLTGVETTDNLSTYRRHSTIVWTAPNSTFLGLNGEGTHLYPQLRMDAAIQQVQGGFENAEIRAKPGVYENVTMNNGNPIVLNGSAVIRPDGGTIVIR